MTSKLTSFGFLFFILTLNTFASDITGAGSTFLYPLISKWADSYNKLTGTRINYQSIGSGGGIKQIQSKTVDFGATDMPLSPEELEKHGLVQFPVIIGGTVPVINLKGIKAGELKLTGPLLADIFLGKIKKWDNPAIQKLNSYVKLPGTDITVVHRSDGSGTSFLWTNYLSKVSAEWKNQVGEGTAVSWPTGVGGKGNDGVTSYVQRIDGSIGYVEFAYASQNHIAWTKLLNSAGNYAQPGAKSFAAAAEGVDWAATTNYYAVLTNSAGKASWPISGAVFILMHKTQENIEHGKQSIKFFRWGLEKGQQVASELNYVPLPSSLVKKIKETWKHEIKGSDGNTLASIQ